MTRKQHDSDNETQQFFPVPNPNDYHVRSYRTPNSKGGFLQQHYITNQIVSPHMYIDMFQDIRLASENDDVFVYINSEGGWVDTGIQFINILNECRGTVYTVLDGKAFSIAATMFLAGPNKIVNSCGSLMIHNYSATVGGKGHELIQTIHGYNNYITDLMEQHHKPFLTDEEFDKVLDGKDLWFKSSGVAERLEVIDELNMVKELENERTQLKQVIAELNEELAEIEEALSPNNEEVED